MERQVRHEPPVCGTGEGLRSVYPRSALATFVLERGTGYELPVGDLVARSRRR